MTYSALMMWDMNFNLSKYQVLHVTRIKNPIETNYFLHDTMLDSVLFAKYLGVTILDDLSWSTHIDNITKIANQTLGFLKRNIWVHNKDLKSVAYKTLIRPQLEYASTVWSAHTATDIQKVEAVQRRAARCVYRGYSYTSSVTAIMKDLNWRPLGQRRIDSRLIMLYKVTYNLVAIPASQYLTRNTRLSRHTHPLSYRQIPTLKRLLQVHLFSKVNNSLECPSSPHTSSFYLGAVQQCCLPGDPCLSLKSFYPFFLYFYFS